MHKMVPALCLPLFNEMPSQQAIFPKRSFGKNPKIDHFSLTTKPHPLSPLTKGLPFLYWLGTRGWCFGPSVCVPIPSAFVFFYSHAISAILAMSHYAILAMSNSTVSLVFVLILHGMEGVGSSTCTISFYFLMGLDIGLSEVLAHIVCWAFALITSLPAISMDLLAVIPAMLAH